MDISTFIPLHFVPVPSHAVVKAIYATAPAPSGGHVRVRVLDVHTLAGRSKVATVQFKADFDTWQVWSFSLTEISAFAVLEVE